MGRFALWTPPGRDVLCVKEDIDTDYVNLEDMLVVFCVDISGSMSVTSEVIFFDPPLWTIFIVSLEWFLVINLSCIKINLTVLS